MAIENVRAHRVSSGLTVFGVVIGVVVVVVVASILTGMRRNVVQSVEERGTHTIFAFHLTRGPRLGPGDRAEYRRKPLRPEDGEAIREQASAVLDVANEAWVWPPDRTLRYGRAKYARAILKGVSGNYPAVTTVALREGRFFSDSDDHHRRDVLVIGTDVADALFPHKASISGSEVLFVGRPFTVVGVLEKRKGQVMGGENEEDSAVFLPYRTARKISPQTSEWLLLLIRARSGQRAAALDQAEEILRRRRGLRSNQPSNFDLATSDRIIQQFDSITAAIGLVAIAISSVSLVVGGVGVMNIMLVSVTERTQEIGVRKAIGARRRDIVRQFLFEAIALTFSGGVIGVLLAVLISRILLFVLPGLPAEVPLWAVAAGLIVSVGVGLAFGVWPAKRAAALDPVEALRYE